MVSLPYYRRKLEMSSPTIQKLISKLRNSRIGEDWPSNFHPEWEGLELKDPVGFARRTMWTACRNIRDGETCTWNFWNCMTDEVINNCIEAYKELAIEKGFNNFIFRGAGGICQVW